MRPRDRLDALTPEEWARLDAALDDLLELDAEARHRKLAAITAERPDEAALLAHLLRAEADGDRLDGHLHSTLSFLAEQGSPPTGTRIGPWRLVKPIGRGGMSEVFLAERDDGAFQRRVALKLIWKGLVGEDGEQFVRQERQILADLDDPRIARLVDGGVHEDGRPWLAMDYIDGENVIDACRTRDIDIPTRVRWIAELARALGSAHRHLIVHGDIKPANVLITHDKQVRLLDFGIGQLIQKRNRSTPVNSSWSAWTPSFASPEQKARRPLTPASDIFQLGLLLSALLDGSSPLPGRRARELAAILGCATALSSGDRYASADRMADDLEALLAHRPVAAMKAGWAYRFRCLLRRRWPAVSLASIAAIAAVGGLTHQVHQTRLLADRHATTEAVLDYLEEMLNQGNPLRQNSVDALSDNILDAAAAGLDQTLGDQPRARTRMLLALGRIHHSRNDVVKAGRLHAEALTLARRNGWNQELEEALGGLAAAGIWSGDYARSENLLRELISLRIDQDHPPQQVAQARLQLADLLHSRGFYSAALEQAQLARRNGGDESRTHLVLGMIQRDLGEFSEALTHFDRSLAIEQARTPMLEFRLTELLDHRGVLFLNEGRFKQAREELEISERMRRGYLGDDWDGLFWSHHWHGLHDFAAGALERSSVRLDAALEDYERHLGSSSHLLAFARSDRAWLALAEGDPQRAAGLFKQARKRLESLQPGDHPRLAEVLLGQSLIALVEGRIPDAQEAAQRASTIRSQLPSAAPGAMRWRTNACRVLAYAERPCPPLRLAASPGLDAQRIDRAVLGLCSVTVTADHGLPCPGTSRSD